MKKLIWLFLAASLVLVLVACGTEQVVSNTTAPTVPQVTYKVSDFKSDTDYPYPALNTLFDEDDEILTFGLCNDAIGYIVPDQDYNAKESHELISVGPKAASTLSAAFIELIEEVK